MKDDHDPKENIHDTDEPEHPEHGNPHDGPATTESDTDPGGGITVGGPPKEDPPPNP